IFMDAQKTEQLLALLGVQNYTGTLSPDDKFHVEGAYPPDNEKSNSAISVLHGIKPMLDLGHISIENNIVSLTEKGKALAELLTQKGFVCNSFLDQTYTENYKPLSVRIQEQYKPK